MKKSPDKNKGFNDLLNYASIIDDGVVLCKDGTHLAGFFYRGKDIDSSTGDERNMVSTKVNNALKELGNGWMIHCDAIRMETTGYGDKSKSHFPDKVTQFIENERRESFNSKDGYFETVYAILISYLPPLKVEGKVLELMYEKTAQEKSENLDIGTRVLMMFQDQIGKIANNLSSIFEIERMKSFKYEDENGDTFVRDTLLSYINRCITGDSQPINLPSTPIYLDCILGSQEFHTGTMPKIGNKYIRCVAIEGFPQESHQGILGILDQLPLEYRWSSRCIFLEQYVAEKEIDKYRRKWKQKIRGFKDQILNNPNGTIDKDAQRMTQQTEDAISDSRGGIVAFGYHTSVIVLMSENPEILEENSEFVRTQIRNLGFTSRIETINTVEAWLGSLPAHGKENIRRPLIHSLNLADCLPTSSLWAGKDVCPCDFYPANSPPLMQCATSGSTPFRLNLHVGDVGHTLIFGPTGAGKSVHLNLISAQFRRYANSNIHIFDKGLSAYVLCKGVGGTHFEIAADQDESVSGKEALAFCPIGHVKSANDVGWLENWLEVCFNMQDLKINPEQRKELHYAVKTTLDNQEKDQISASLTTLCANIQNKELRAALEPYTVSGPQGQLLDAEEDGLALSSFTVYEIEHLMNLGEKYIIPVLLYVFWRIEKSLDGRPSLIILDEAWVALGHPVFRDKLREWLKVLRKANCAVVLATQNIVDAIKSGIIEELDQACPTKIFLPNPVAKNEKIADLYYALGLNDKQIDILSEATPKRQYYYTSTSGNRLYELDLGKKALSFIAKSDKESIKTIKLLERKHGDDWIKYWLEENDIFDFEN